MRVASEENERHVAVTGGKKHERKGETEITPWRPEAYMGQIDMAFDDLARRFESTFAPFPRTWFAPRRRMLHELSQVRYPYADLIDSGNEYRVLAEVPGIPREKLDITVTSNEIRIEGEAKTDIKEEKEGFVRRERGYSRVSRSLSFPEQVVADKAEASLSNGVLEVRVPKKTATKVTRHKVAVK
jgi:HSP20 family protein